MSVLCPFCEGQGEVYRVVVQKTDEQIYLCDECDTVWLTEKIGEDNATNFEDFMTNRGLEPLWDELKNVEKL